MIEGSPFFILRVIQKRADPVRPRVGLDPLLSHHDARLFPSGSGRAIPLSCLRLFFNLPIRIIRDTPYPGLRQLLWPAGGTIDEAVRPEELGDTPGLGDTASGRMGWIPVKIFRHCAQSRIVQMD